MHFGIVREEGNDAHPTAAQWADHLVDLINLMDHLGPRLVKAYAYGHGLGPVSKIVLNAEVDWLGVHSLEERVHLRESGIAGPILILGYVALDDLP